MSDDNLIDRVARGMTAGARVPDLSERVRARIAGTPQQRRWRWTLVPLAGLATAAVIALITGPDDSGSGFRESGTPQFANGAAPGLPASAPGVPESQSPQIPESPNSRFTVSSSAAEWETRAVPALPAVEPLAIERIQPIALSIPLLEVEPLVVPANGGDR